jgi:hypothetical protein
MPIPPAGQLPLGAARCRCAQLLNRTLHPLLADAECGRHLCVGVLLIDQIEHLSPTRRDAGEYAYRLVTCDVKRHDLDQDRLLFDRARCVPVLERSIVERSYHFITDLARKVTIVSQLTGQYTVGWRETKL